MNGIAIVCDGDGISHNEENAVKTSFYPFEGHHSLCIKNSFLFSTENFFSDRSIEEDYNIFVLINGYITNVEEILEILGDKTNSNLPINILLAKLYRRYGEESIVYIKGAFSLIIYDSEKNKIIAAKDHMSMKPLYYAQTGNKLVISSTMSAIYNQAFFYKEFNQKRIDEYFNGLIQKSDHTFFKNIFCVPRASYLIAHKNEIKVKKYFEFNTETELILSNDTDYALATRENFIDVLKKYSNLFDNFAAKLSGGLDSTSICCGLRKLYPERKFSCLNINYQGLDDKALLYSDEAKYVDDAESYSNLNLIRHKININDYPVISFLREMYSRSDILIPSFNQAFQISAFKALKNSEVRAIFDGFDGDSSISFGTEKFFLLASKMKLTELYKERLKYSKTHNLSFSKINILKKAMSSLFKRRPQGNAQFLHSEVFNYYGWDLALEYTENHANIFGFEELYPFFDRDLMQYLISLPVSQKLNEGRSRYHFRNAMNGIIPDSVKNRYTKGNLSKMWIDEVKRLNISELDKIFQDTGSEKYFDTRKTIQELIQLKNENVKNESYFANTIFQKISFSLWIESNNKQ